MDMKKLTIILAGAVLSASGCFNLPPKHPANPELKPIMPKKEKAFYEEIEKRGNTVADFIEENSPEGIVIYIRGNTSEQDRYISLRLLREGDRRLEINLYRTSEINEKMKDFFLYNEDERHIIYNISSAKILEENYIKKAVMSDFGINGLGKDSEDFVIALERGNEGITLKNGRLTKGSEIKEDKKENLEDLWDTANRVYLDYLMSLTPR